MPSSVLLALRRISSVILAVSFVAMAGSGLLLLSLESLELQLRMRPVHDVFGIGMTAAGAAHLALNWRPLLAHLRQRWPRLVGIALAGLLALLVAAGFAHPVDREAIGRIEAILRTSQLD